jgi:hypothetical protein
MQLDSISAPLSIVSLGIVGISIGGFFIVHTKNILGVFGQTPGL